MQRLLAVNASGRVTRSVTRSMVQRFVERWETTHADGEVLHRDVGIESPPAVSEPWIAAAYSEPNKHDDRMREAIAVSDELIDELLAADAVVIGAPIYNFGMPAQLKAWIDQIVRVGRTFDIDPGRENPYVPLAGERPVTVLVSAGDIELHPGGTLASLNHMEPHLRTVLGFIGMTEVRFIRTGNEEFADARHQKSVEAAMAEIDAIAASLPTEV